MARRPAAGRPEAGAVVPMMMRAGLALVWICALATPSHALDSEQKRGKALLQSLCSRCHAVDRTGASPHADAPPFRTFGDSKLYDDDFAQRLQSGLSTIHRDMPSFQFDRADAEAQPVISRPSRSAPGGDDGLARSPGLERGRCTAVARFRPF